MRMRLASNSLPSLGLRTRKSAGASSLRVPSGGVKCPSRRRLQPGLNRSGFIVICRFSGNRRYNDKLRIVEILLFSLACDCRIYEHCRIY